MFCLLVSFPTQTLFLGWCTNKSYVIATSDLWLHSCFQPASLIPQPAPLHLNYNNLPGLLICIDFEKAFDSVDWNFMMKVLETFGFGSIICQWIYTFQRSLLMDILHPVLFFFILKEDVVTKAIQFRLICFCCVSVEILGIMIRENN